MCPLEAVQVSELEVTWCAEKPHFSVNDRRGTKVDREKNFGDELLHRFDCVGRRGLGVLRVSSLF